MLSRILGLIVWIPLTIGAKGGGLMSWVADWLYPTHELDIGVTTLELLADTAKEDGIIEFWEELSSLGCGPCSI